MKRLFAAGFALITAMASPNAWAQGLGLGGNDDVPLEVYADNGIEWRQNDNTYIARGNAKAIKGATTVYADVLVAHYRKAAAAGAATGGTSGGSEVWKVEANGNVRIVSTEETAYGEKAVYTIDDGALIMTGGNLKLVTPRETITARERLEYWDKKNLAVARGDALTVTEDGRRIRADTLTALFKPPKNQQEGAAKPAPAPTRVAGNSAAQNKNAANRQPRGDSRLDRMDAVGNVVITTPEEVARGERGVYFEDSGIATLTGSVKITRGQNQLNGDAAEVNLRTGVSRMLNQPGRNSGPVRALLVPEKREESSAPADSTPSNAPRR